MTIARLARKALALFRLVQIATTVLNTIQKSKNPVNRNVPHPRKFRSNRQPRLPIPPRQK